MSGPTAESNGAPVPAASVQAEYFTSNEFSVVLWDAPSRRVIRLNPSASAVWSLMDAETTTDDLANDIAEIFGLEASAASQSVLESVEEFRSAGLLEGPQSTQPEDYASDSFSNRLAREPDP